MPLKLVPGRHGSPFIYLRGSVRGIRVDESTGVSDQKAAEEIRIRREAELLNRSIHGDAISRTFGEAAASYLATGGDGTHLEALLRHFGPKTKLGEIGQHEIEAAAHKLLPRAGPATLNRQIYTPISAVLHHAARKKWCPKPVISRPRQPAGRVRWISHEEADKLIAAAPPHLKPLVIFLLSTGARLSEALYLDWRDVDLSRGHVTFIDTKNGESRGVPLPAEAVAALASLPWDRKGAVFRKPGAKGLKDEDGKVTSRKWEPYAEREGGGGQVKTGWAAMLRRAGISDFTPHDCRHTWATWHYIANKDIPSLMELGGWKSVEMVMRYAHTNTAHLAAGMQRVWGNRPAKAV